MSPPHVLLVTILPETELPAVLMAFDCDPRQSERVLDWESYRTRLTSSREGHREVDILIVCLTKQGNTETQASVSKLLPRTKPQLALLVGCACGRDDTTKFCDVVVSTDGVYYYEPVGGNGSLRPVFKQPSNSLANTLAVMLTKANLTKYGWPARVESRCRRLKRQVTMAKLPRPFDPSVHFRVVASGEKVVTSTYLKRLARNQGNIYAGDKESAGFAMACDTDPELQRRWLAVRGVSDFGKKDEREQWKVGASLAAALFARSLIERIDFWSEAVTPGGQGVSGTTRSVPAVPHIEEHSLYSRKRIPDLMRIASREQGLDLSFVRFTRDLTISQLERICWGAKRKILREARARAYEEKYGKRTPTEDERFTLVGFKHWQAEFARVLVEAVAPRSLSALDILDVGVGNGTELQQFVGKVKSLTVVDIARTALQEATSLLKGVKSRCCAAEDLDCVGSASVDAYISLRTFQSTLFDPEPALAEARRVLRPNGSILLSIPTKFHDLMTDKVTEGLLVGPETNDVSADLPLQELDRLRRLLQASQFTDIGFSSGHVEIYVWARRA